ncbi:MAG TPA: hypothetical protein VFQ53_12140 [Kofleriaceae bacterium]|nr:hypothetical protein [Kofleriaceae bacterium]
MRIALTFNQRRGDCSPDDESQAEFDTLDAIATIARLVASLGHHVTPIDVTGSIPALVDRLTKLAPDVVLNLAEGERGAFREAFYPALFEQLGLPYTGSAPATLAVCLEKALAKRVVASARVRVPRGELVRDADALCDLPGPLIVKPNSEGSSKGITRASVIDDPACLRDRVRTLLARYPGGVLVEEFVVGIDVAVGWVDGLGLLPAIWYRYDDPDPLAIYDYARKHVHPDCVENVVPAPLGEDVTRRLEDAARRAFGALGVRGYGRADFRITPEGDVVFLEMNPLPSLTLATGHDELYVAAARTGTSVRGLLAAILEAVPRCDATEPVPLPRSA